MIDRLVHLSYGTLFCLLSGVASASATGASAATTAAQPLTTFHVPVNLDGANRKRAVVCGIACLVVLVAVAVAGVLLAQYASEGDLALKNLSPSLEHLFGTDRLALFPGLALLAVVMLFDVVGQSVRRLVDPHQAQR